MLAKQTVVIIDINETGYGPMICEYARTMNLGLRDAAIDLLVKGIERELSE